MTGPLRARLLAGGRSRLTYEVSDGTRSWVVRRPPLGHVLATAHDMGREYRVMAALHGTGPGSSSPASPPLSRSTLPSLWPWAAC
jgi:aminoglycoside phosphotransferase (APT) family kinase protein